MSTSQNPYFFLAGAFFLSAQDLEPTEQEDPDLAAGFFASLFPFFMLIYKPIFIIFYNSSLLRIYYPAYVTAIGIDNNSPTYSEKTEETDHSAPSRT